MMTQVNMQALRATRVRSASIGPLGVVIHPLLEAAEYFGTVYREESALTDLRIVVDPRHSVEQVDIDLAGIDRSAGLIPRELSYLLTPGGHLVLFASFGLGGYHVVLYRSGAKETSRTPAFDSRFLSVGDLFAVTLLRPGTWELAEELGGVNGIVQVEYPQSLEKASRPLPLMGRIGAKLEPADLRVVPGQPIVFSITSGSVALAVKLVRPDNGPSGEGDRAKERKAKRDERRKLTRPGV